ncbi:MAG: hypothetical protein KAS18_09980, partial [Calditrichia bacterium]|nr:hypothetical protein [Calditrichia bacterium]
MKKNIIYIIVSLIFISCVEKIPTNEDGNFKYSAVVIDTMGILPFDSLLGYAPFKHRDITLESTSYYKSLSNRIKYYGQTDKNGYIEFLNLSYSEFLFYSNFIDTVKYNAITGMWDSTKLGAIQFI